LKIIHRTLLAGSITGLKDEGHIKDEERKKEKRISKINYTTHSYAPLSYLHSIDFYLVLAICQTLNMLAANSKI